MRRLNRCPEDADDLTQEVCLRFLAVDQLQWSAKQSRYLFGMARHVLADFRTQRARERAYLVSGGDEHEPSIEQNQVCGV